jgi:hypothetical protein
MRDLVIQPQNEKKGRAFHATCVALATANALLDESGSETIRPVWGVFAGSEAELKPFMANLRLGRKAEPWANRHGNSQRVEFLKSVGYVVSYQRESEGAIATIYHPELFRLDPGMVDPGGLKFVMMVPDDWSARQSVDPVQAVKHVRTFKPSVDDDFLAALVPSAYLFAAYLDRRTRCPLIADGRFYLQLLCAALFTGMASFPGDSVRGHAYHSHASEWGFHRRFGFNITVGGIDKTFQGPTYRDVGLCQAIAFSASHEDFESFLAEQVSYFFERVERNFTPLSERVDLSAFIQENA